MNIAIVGGGAAGFFAAIQCARLNPANRVSITEKGEKGLGKVLISGGGRCNVTHATTVPKQLILNYPRGGKELLGPFHTFGPKDTMRWFEAQGVRCKTESDGRVFPTTDQSSTIVQALTGAAKDAGVHFLTQTVITSIEKTPGDKFRLQFKDKDPVEVDRLLLATGSAAKGLRWAGELGHTLVPPVPSLFTFSISDSRLEGLAGISVASAAVHLSGTNLSQTGPLLVTHWGVSGPAILKLSAWGARIFHERNYKTALEINWLNQPTEKTVSALKRFKASHAKKHVSSEPAFPLPKRLWEKLAARITQPAPQRWADMSNVHINELAAALTKSVFSVSGKSTFKEEFVTCGGVSLKEVDFRTMESRPCPGLYFAGEILNIDAVTGGFNFQNAWTTAWVAANAMAGPAR